MSDHVSTASTPTGIRGAPVMVDIEAPVPGPAEASEAWECNENLDLMQQQQQLLQQPAEFLDPAQPRVNNKIPQGSPAAAAWQLMPEAGSAGATYGRGPESAEQNVDVGADIDTAEQYQEAGSSYSAADTDLIKGSPALEAMQSMTSGGSAAAGSAQTDERTAADTHGTAWQPFADTATSQPAETGNGAPAADTLLSPSTAAPSIDASRQSTAYNLQSPTPPTPLAGRSALLVAAKPSAFLGEVAQCLVKRGARVTLAVRHAQDGHLFVKKLHQQLAPETRGLLSSTACPLNFASQTSVRQFASAINASDEQLDLLLLHTLEPTGIGRRWYTPEGTAGTAQVGFLAPATLLRLLEPKLGACGASVLLTTTPLHRLGQLDDADYMMTTWAGASAPDTQLALLAYARQMAQRLAGQGMTVAAIDMGPLREQPLAGSLLRKLPPLSQLLHLLLPSAHDAAHLLADIAETMIAEKKGPVSGGAATTTAEQEPARPPITGTTARTISACMGAQDAGFGSPSDSADDLAKLAPAHSEGQQPARLPSTGMTARTISACMGAQDAGFASASASADDLPKLAPPHNEGESVAFKAGEQLGADLKLLEALMQHEGGHQAAEGATASGSQQVERAESAAEGVAGPSAPGSKARDSSFAAAPAGAVDDSFSYSGWGVLSEQAKQSQVPGKQQAEAGTGTVAGTVAGPLDGSSTAGGAPKSFRYLSRGLLANPLLTSLDHAGRSSWLMHTFSSLMFPWYQITASSVVRGTMLLDWPVRAWFLAPAGAVSNFGKRMMGPRAARLLSQLQRGVPGVRGVPNSATPQWVEVTPAGLVMDDALGDRLWAIVEQTVRV